MWESRAPIISQLLQRLKCYVRTGTIVKQNWQLSNENNPTIVESLCILTPIRHSKTQKKLLDLVGRNRNAPDLRLSIKLWPWLCEGVVLVFIYVLEPHPYPATEHSSADCNTQVNKQSKTSLLGCQLSRERLILLRSFLFASQPNYEGPIYPNSWPFWLFSNDRRLLILERQVYWRFFRDSASSVVSEGGFRWRVAAFPHGRLQAHISGPKIGKSLLRGTNAHRFLTKCLLCFSSWFCCRHA